MNKLFLALLSFVFLGCQGQPFESLVKYDEQRGVITFNINDQKIESHNQTGPVKNWGGELVQRGFILDNSNVFMEYIRLRQAATWSGHPKSLYHNLIKEKLSLKSLDILNKQEYNNYEFITYQVNKKEILYLIYVWQPNTNVFIFDKKGNIFKALLAKFNPIYVNEWENEPTYQLSFNYGLIRENTFKRHFYKDN